MPKTVHLIFKTHLDVGFTNLAATVVRQYLESYIPQAMAVARELRRRGGEERFLWTTGSWLIYQYLEQTDAKARATMEAAIAAGDIRWHALPFTTHTEAMTPALLRAGLGLSQELDRRFGVRTIAAKMTDVPGHTRGLVPMLAEAGVEFLHLGVNPACPAPHVPDLFRWRDPESDAQVTVMYHKSGYGNATRVDGLDQAIVFAHTGDNCGPQSANQIVEQYDQLRQQFPGARLLASTMDAFATALRPVVPALPIIEAELGDTWIHGLGTDPAKLAAFRQLCRCLDAWTTAGRAAAVQPFARALLMIPEHTWGLDVKTHLGDYLNYARPDFEAARQRDRVDAPVPEKYSFVRPMLTAGERSYRRLEASWQEQRDYLAQACNTLADPALLNAAQAALAELQPAPPDLDGFQWQPDDQQAPVETTHFQVAINPQTGALASLLDRRQNLDWAATREGLGLLRYQTFAAADYDRYMAAYNLNLEHPWCRNWAIPDFAKPGMETTVAPAAMHLPTVRRTGLRRTAEATTLIAELAFADSAHRDFGAPARAWLEYTFPYAAAEVHLRLQWFDKPASRLPEALLFCLS